MTTKTALRWCKWKRAMQLSVSQHVALVMNDDATKIDNVDRFNTRHVESTMTQCAIICFCLIHKSLHLQRRRQTQLWTRIIIIKWLLTALPNRRLAKRILQQKSNTEVGDDLIPNNHITLLHTATITKNNPAIGLTKTVGCVEYDWREQSWND
jgi:hypothetical protein